MDGDHTLQPVFAEITDLTLTITVEGSGNVYVDPDQATYNYGDMVELTAVPEEGAGFDGWSGDATGASTIITVEMTDNLDITATFLPSYTLEITVDGQGTTDPSPGTYGVLHGGVAEVDALPNTGYKLDHWLLDNVDVGFANPYQLTMESNHGLVAVFVEDILFSDGFESGDLSAWSGPTTTSGESAIVAGDMPHSGSFAGEFSTNGDGGVERSYVTANVGGSDVYVRGYFNIQAGLPMADTDDRFNLYSFMTGTTTLASLSVRHAGGQDVWSITSIDGVYYAGTGPAMDQWYSVEFYIHIGTSDGELALWVDGTPVFDQTGLNMGSSDVTSIRNGLVYVNAVTENVELINDDVAISDTYIGPLSETPQYTLTINYVGNGIVTKLPNQATYHQEP